MTSVAPAVVPSITRRNALGGLLAAAGAIAVPAFSASHEANAATLSQGYRALSLAKTFCGRTPYVYGGTTPRGFDCSGLTQYVYRKQGIRIPRTAQAQRGAMRRISRASARPGDLVFFHSGRSVYHVGIYAGNGKMVDAGSRRSGIKHRTIWSRSVSFGTLR